LKLFSNLKGDIMGGVTTSVIALPLAIAFGIVAYAPLGEAYIAYGALTGLYGVIVAGILTSIFGGTPGQIAVPTAPMSVMVTSIIATLMKEPQIMALGENQVLVILVLVSLTIFMAGMLQLVMGAIGGGKLIKFIPYPVIGGFMNGIAIIIFLGQLRPLMGVPKETPIVDMFLGNAGYRIETVIVGIVTIVAMLLAKRFIKSIPSSLVGLLAGVAAFFAVGTVLNPAILQIEGNPLVIGQIPSVFPTPKQVMNFIRLSDQIPMSLLTMLIVPAITLSILASIDTLLTSVVTDMVTKNKHNSTRELFGQGIGNVASAAFGGLPVAGSTLATMVNINAGGRTPLGGIVSSLTVLLIIMFMGSLVQWIPMAVLAGILLITSVSMLESESIHLSLKKSAIGNLLVIVAVTIITVAVDLIIAVLVGLVITMFLFVKEQISRSIVRRMFTGNLVHSKKIRSKEAMATLQEKGDKINIYELNGSLFFGTADKLLAEIEKHLDSFCIILDFKRIHTVDLTGAQLLKQIVERITEKGNCLLVSYLDLPGNEDKKRMYSLLQDVGVVQAIGADNFFPDTDRALQWAEDALIARELGRVKTEHQKLMLHNLNVFHDLSKDQLDVVRQYLHPARYGEGDVVFEEGERGDKIYFILSGEVSVLAHINENGRATRVASFGEGVFFGDMAILEDRPRSASVRADSETELLYMTVEDFQYLVKNESLIASRMLMGMARELSYRLRNTTIEVRTLEE